MPSRRTRRILVGVTAAVVVSAPLIALPALAGDVPVTGRGAAGPGTYAGVRLTQEQVTNARIIMEVGRKHKIPEYGLQIALATAMQESTLKNLKYGDRDSQGLFQQRPSMGWGTIAQITTPELAAEAFYGVAKHTSNPGLTDIKGWESMSVTRAAQAVQRSAYPDAYAKWANMALELVRADREPSPKPTTAKPTTAEPTAKPTAAKPTANPSTAKPTANPSTVKPTATGTARPSATVTVKPSTTTTAGPSATGTARPSATAKPSGTAQPSTSAQPRVSVTPTGQPKLTANPPTVTIRPSATASAAPTQSTPATDPVPPTDPTPSARTSTPSPESTVPDPPVTGSAPVPTEDPASGPVDPASGGDPAAEEYPTEPVGYDPAADSKGLADTGSPASLAMVLLSLSSLAGGGVLIRRRAR